MTISMKRYEVQLLIGVVVPTDRSWVLAMNSLDDHELIGEANAMIIVAAPLDRALCSQLPLSPVNIR
jgi:hypothetical protein